jgi:phosphoserine aminotransferase
MISFYPGPSRVYDSIPQYVKDAHKAGILSVNHRSDDFMAMSKRTITLLRQKLAIPKTYTVFFTSSATECWEIIAQSLYDNGSYHLFNGAFGEKWFDYTRRLHPQAVSLSFDVNSSPDHSAIPLGYNGLVCLTQNETSNGTQITKSILKEIRKNHPAALIAVDATSSMAGISLDFKSADIWYASVQKCFGLPAGLGILICSPGALERASQIKEHNHYNSLTFMMQMMEKWQTPFTPNVLAIYLLMRVLEELPGIADTEEKTISRYHEWIDFMQQRATVAHFVTNKSVRSYTVIPVTASEETIVSIKKEARSNSILLGEGYGPFKAVTFRIANFPAIKDSEIKILKTFLKKY